MKILLMFLLFVPPLYVTGFCNHNGKKYNVGEEIIKSCADRCHCTEDNGIECVPYCMVAMPMCLLGMHMVEGLGPVDKNGCRCKFYKCTGKATGPKTIFFTTTKKPTSTPAPTYMLHGCRYGDNIYFDGDEFIKGCKERCTCHMIRYDLYEATCSPYCFTFPIPCRKGQEMVYEDGPPDDNKCRCKMAKCKALPSAPLGCKSNKKTTGGSAKGACCVFPFKYKGIVYNDCTSVDSRHAWCYTEKHRKWGYCQGETNCKSGMHTRGGNAGGACCIFPFKYDGKIHTSCTMLDHSRPWCYTEKVGKWGNCPDQRTDRPPETSPAPTETSPPPTTTRRPTERSREGPDSLPDWAKEEMEYWQEYHKKHGMNGHEFHSRDPKQQRESKSKY